MIAHMAMIMTYFPERLQKDVTRLGRYKDVFFRHPGSSQVMFLTRSRQVLVLLDLAPVLPVLAVVINLVTCNIKAPRNMFLL